MRFGRRGRHVARTEEAPAPPPATAPGAAPPAAAPPADGTSGGTVPPPGADRSDPAGAGATGSAGSTGTVLRGSVMTGDGWPLQGATVTVLVVGEQAGRVTSRGDGAFELPGLPPGPATLLVAAPSYEPHARSVAVPAGPSWDIGTVVMQRQGAQEVPPVGRWVIDPMHTSVTATAHHLGLSAVHGHFSGYEGVITVADPPEDSGVEVRIDAATIDTGIGQRDDHLRSPDFLDVARHPWISYRSTAITPSGPGRWLVDGELTLLETARPVRLDLRYTGTGPDPWGGQRIAFHATTQLERDDFRMNWNQAVNVGIAVFGTTLKVAIDVEAVLEA